MNAWCNRNQGECSCPRCNFTAYAQTIFGFTTSGGVEWSNLVLAQKHAREWQSVTLPREGERGGSSSPREVEERNEDRRVASQALRDQAALMVLVPAFEQELIIAGYTKAPTRELMRVAERLAQVVARCVQTVDATKLPTEAPAGCRSCGRKDMKRGMTGHFSPVSKRYEGKALCDQCGRYAGANKGKWPPIEFVDVLARQGAHAAGRWLARNDKRRKAS